MDIYKKIHFSYFYLEFRSQHIQSSSKSDGDSDPFLFIEKHHEQISFGFNFYKNINNN